MISPTTSSLVSGAPTLDSVSPVTSIKLFLTKESTPSLMTKSLKKGMKSHLRFSKSIEDSRIAIIVFSKEYASSSFYLDELVHIIHFSNEKGSTIIPVFYGTEPSHVRKLNGSYGEALAKHEEQFQNSKENMERLLKWKKALNQAANLSGHHFNLGNEYERDFIEKIVTDVSNKINHVPLHVADYLVGLKSRISKVNSLSELGSNDGVCMIGILGTGGMGKTTLSQAVYNSIVHQFEFKCFLHNVRENSVKHGIPIIKRRLYQKKVLLIVDDVDKIKQVQVLIGEASWLGRDTYGLNKEQALELLRTKAFKSKKNDSSYDYILNRAVKYASGLPLALEVVGSNLFGKSIAECESLLDKYDRIPHEDIQKILKVSYDALAEEQQSVFLDIACVFKGRGKEYVQEVLHDHYGYCIKSHIGVLVDKSLIKINGKYIGRVTLHDLIEDMGMEIVRQESIKEPGKRSRLWCRDDIVHVLQEKKGTSKIEMIYLNSPSMKPVDMNEKAFKKMTNLKTLIIEKGNFSKGPKYLPSSLVFCKWIGCPSKTLSFLSNKNFEDMKHLILDRSQSLIHIPNVSSLQNLIKFSFENCRNLIKIDNSIWKLNKLEHLSAKGCLKLESFPPLHLPSLKELELSKCDSLKSFPELLCQMTNIKEINLCDTSIGEFPFSFQYLSELVFLQVNRVRMLRFQKYNDRMNPIMFSKMYSVILGETNLSDECLPILLKLFVNVTSLKLMKNNFKILPECLSECHRLGELVLDDCKFLEEIRGIPPNLGRLSALRCESLSLESRRRLLSQDLHEAGCTKISFPNGSEGIPDWFEHQRKGDTFSFWAFSSIRSVQNF
ncbi:NB-ARC domain protein [Medicago truncatula]|uniref:NB-ARC domain protein n=1 Tax=Medicago truncatula TaxID=3880 RepID=G7KIH9_MEDTR|nr:NB-ARC domain protein [Medicago truncatula]